MIPYGRQNIDEDDIAAVVEVLRGDFLTTGPKIKEFEDGICATTGAKFAVACSNGTTALHLAALALDIKPGDAVIVPSMTFLATANAVRYCGGDVVFADVNPQTGLMEAAHLEDALKRCGDLTPRAIFPVHLTGQCVDIEAITAVARNAGLKVVADSAHAIGGELHGKPVGTCEFEDLNTFSFHPVKTIAMGEGGAVTTNDKDMAQRMARLRHHGMQATPERGPWAYEMQELGYNYRVTDMQCALGISQLKKLDKFVARRCEIVALYDELLAPLAPVIIPPPKVDYCNPAWHLYAAAIDFKALGRSRADVMRHLHENGVGTQVHYIPVHSQPYYKNLYGEIALPGVEAYYERTLSLPLYPAMKDENIEFIVGELKNLMES